MNDRRRPLVLALVLAGVALLAWVPRSVEVQRHPRADGAGWFSHDPDGLYHTRRVERALRDGLRVASTDPYLAYPEGARIPWPPYYDLAVALAAKPFAPDGERERRAFLEQFVALLPRLFGVACALLAAAVAWQWGTAPALVAGATVALCRGTVNYSVVGTGDHHAWIALLAAALLAVAGAAVRRGALTSRARGAAWGAVLGAIAGAMVGSWVAALLYVLSFQLALGWLLVRRAREALPGVATLGLAFHSAALLVLLPAIVASPWRAEFPWMVVNLSWFHALELALGALVFVPLIALEHGALAARTRAARAYPLGVAVSLAALGAVAWLVDAPPARGIAEGMAWVSRADAFMDTVQESAPLIGPRADGDVLFLALGYGVVLLPLALGLAAQRAFWRAADELVPWVIATAALLVQALAQRRFADPLAVPMAVVLAFAASLALARWPRRWLAATLVALALVSQLPSARSAKRMHADDRAWVGSKIDYVLGERTALEWIDAHGGEPRDWSVLSHWDRGHTIEWAANAPSVATNFGSYVGVDSYRDPSRFFLSESEDEALAVLERRRVRFVYAPAALMDVVASMCRAAAPQLRERYLAPHAGGGTRLTPSWFHTMGARLLFGGVDCDAEAQLKQIGNPLGTLRLVHVAAYLDARRVHPVTRQPSPVAYVWERVRGATVETRAEPGEALEVAFDVEYAAHGFKLAWRARATADAAGRARIRVPYCSDEPNGDGRVAAARWSAGARGGPLAIPAGAVRDGATIGVE